MKREQFLPSAPGGRGRFWVLAALVAALVLAPQRPCRAQETPVPEAKADLLEMSVEQLMTVEVATVFGASKHEQKVTEAPASVSIVTGEEIKRFGYRTLAEALRSVRGIYLSNDRNYTYLGMRGFSRPGDLNTRVLLLVDGHPINDNIFESAPVGTEFPVDVDLIDRIEVIRGPSSSLYGSNAFFGVVNLITRRPADLSGTQLAAAAGSFQTYNGRLSYAGEFGSGLGLLLSGSLLRSEGARNLYFPEFDDPATNNGVARHADQDRNYQLYGKLSWRDFSLVSAYVSRTKGVPTGSYGTVFNDGRNRTTDSHGFLDLKYLHRFEETELSLRAFFDGYYYNGSYIFDQEQEDGSTLRVQNRDKAQGVWWGVESQATRTFWDRHKVTAGLLWRDNSLQKQYNFDVIPPAWHLDDRRRSNLWALYLQDESQLLPSLSLSLGVRHDQYDSFGGTTNPRLALIYQPWEGSVFKLIYGQAFRAPSAYEFYYSDGSTQKANPSLKPETIRTYEAVWEQYFLQHYRSSLSGFYYRISDLISQVSDPGDGKQLFINVDEATARGAELELEGNWDNGIRGKLSYSYQRAKDARTGKELTNSPEHLAKLQLNLPLLRRALWLGVEQQYQSSRGTLAGRRTGAAWPLNLTLSGHPPLRGLELSLSLYNLWDDRYRDPGAGEHVQDSLRQDGRSFRVKAEYSF